MESYHSLSPMEYKTACEAAYEEYTRNGFTLPRIGKLNINDSELKQQNKITAAEIQILQNLIENCLKLYMNLTEIITALKVQANVEEEFSKLVWKKLEEGNPEFFMVYDTRLRLAEQITAFNYLVSQQLQVMKNQIHELPITTKGSLLDSSNPIFGNNTISNDFKELANTLQRTGKGIPAPPPVLITENSPKNTGRKNSSTPKTKGTKTARSKKNNPPISKGTKAPENSQPIEAPGTFAPFPGGNTAIPVLSAPIDLSPVNGNSPKLASSPSIDTLDTNAFFEN